ncbi:MAG: PQ-loop domain-containing transporter [Patescibacteria group bacterium]
MEKFVEFQNWGFNLLILSSLMTMIFSILQGYGFIKQSQKIWREKSVKAISPPFFFLFFFYFIAFIIYGFHKNSLAMVFNGFLFIPCIPVVIGIIKFKKMKLVDWLSFFASALILPGIFL